MLANGRNFDLELFFFIENMKDEYKAYEGRITFSGTLLYLYYEPQRPLTDFHCGFYIHSLYLKDIQKRELTEEDFSNH